jgi:trimeric autotransporter adhesin
MPISTILSPRLAGIGGVLLVALALAPAEAQVTGAGGSRSLGTLVNGVEGGACSSGACGITGGTSSGSNLYHRFSAFDTRGGITGVGIDTQGRANVIVGVINPLGSFIDKPVSLSSGGNLFWLSPGGVAISGAGGFQNVQNLNLSTATGLRFAGGGRFDVLATTAAEASSLSGEPLAGSGALLTDPGTLASLGLSGNGALSLDGGLLTVDGDLLLDAQGGNVLLQAAALSAPGASLTIKGREVVLNEGSLDVSSTTGAGGRIDVIADSILQNASLRANGQSGGTVNLEATTGSLLSTAPIEAIGRDGVGGQLSLIAGGSLLQTAASRLDASGSAGGGSVSVTAGPNLFSSGSYRADGEGSGATGGSIALGGRSITLAAASLSANGSGRGGSLLVGGSTAEQITIQAFSTLSAEATRTGPGGSISIRATDSADVQGVLQAKGGPLRGNGGRIEVVGQENLRFAANADASAPQGAPGSLVLESRNLLIDSAGIGPNPGFTALALPDPNPGPGQAFGQDVETLSNGNQVVTDPLDNLFASQAGAVYLFDGTTGSLRSALVGTKANDRVGSDGISSVGSGNFVINSSLWANGSNAAAGAVSWGSGALGVSGAVSEVNSLVGSGANDRIGSRGVTVLSSGNYVVNSPDWALGTGAVSWGSGAVGLRGAVGAGNSLVGGQVGDRIGSGGVTALANGNYVVTSPGWTNGAARFAGAVTWGDGSTGVRGEASAGNSLVGTQSNDRVGSRGVTALTNGNYVVNSFSWANGANPFAGAVTWGNGTAGVRGAVSEANSLVGSQIGDFVGLGGITALADGNYVVSSWLWRNGTVRSAGAVTRADGSTGLAGAVSSLNSLVGQQSGDQVGSGGVKTLNDGSYVVSSPSWANGTSPLAGAITVVNGPAGLSGPVSSLNSLVGSQTADLVGSGGVTELSNGNLVVNSPNWADGTARQVGAVTWLDRTAPFTGAVGAANSLLGNQAGDRIGSGGITALGNGNYVVNSPDWANGANPLAGAVTWRDGNATNPARVNPSNSLVGTQAGDRVGSAGITPLANGNYVVNSPGWANGSNPLAGAVTWGSGSLGVSGPVDAANSLVGSQANDQVGAGGVIALSNGNYVVSSPFWANGANPLAGAVTWGDGAGGRRGEISIANSLIGRSANDTVGAFVDCSGGCFATPLITEVPGDGVAISSPSWKAPDGATPGALTRMDANTGALLDGAPGGVITPANSVIGAQLPGSPEIISFQPDSGGVATTPDVLEDVARTGTNLIVQANNDLSLAPDSQLVLERPDGTAGSLTLRAGRSLTLGSSIVTDGANVTLEANSSATDPAFRESGDAQLSFAPGVGVQAPTAIISLTLEPSRPGAGSGPLNLNGVELNAGGGSTGGTILIDAASIQVEGSNLVSSGSNDGGVIGIGTGSPLPSQVSLINSGFNVSAPPAVGGSITVDGELIGISGSTFNLVGQTGGLLSLGSAATTSLSLDAGTNILLGPEGFVDIKVDPDAVDNNAIVTKPPEPPPGPPVVVEPPVVVIPPPDSVSPNIPSPPQPPGQNPVAGFDESLILFARQSVNQQPLRATDLAFFQPVAGQNSEANIFQFQKDTFLRIGLEDGSFKPANTADFSSSVLGSRAPSLNGTVTLVDKAAAIQGFADGELKAQQETAEQLGLGSVSGSETPSIEGVQRALQKRMCERRSKSSSASCVVK